MTPPLPVLLLLAARAHVGDVIDTRDAHLRPEGLVVEGTFGLLVPDGAAQDGSFAWVCHEAVTHPLAILSPSYAFGGGRTVAWMVDLVQARDGLGVWTTDDRCSWTPATGLDGRLVAEATVTAHGVVWAATADPDAPNALHRAADGVSFAPAHEAQGRFVSVRASGDAVWAVSVVGEDAVTVWHSPDGTAFTAHPVAVPPEATRPIRARLEVVLPEDPTQAWLVLDPIGTDQVLHLTDAGASATVVWDAPDRVTDLARAPDGALYAVLNDLRPWRSPGPGQPFVALDAFVDTSGLDVDAQRAVFAHRTFVTGLLASDSTSGATPGHVWATDAVTGPLTCPADSDQALICEPLWDGLQARLIRGGDTADTAIPAPPDTATDFPPIPRRCGCVSGAGAPTGAAGAGLLVLLGLRRRSRTRAR